MQKKQGVAKRKTGKWSVTRFIPNKPKQKIPAISFTAGILINYIEWYLFYYSAIVTVNVELFAPFFTRTK